MGSITGRPVLARRHVARPADLPTHPMGQKRANVGLKGRLDHRVAPSMASQAGRPAAPTLTLSAQHAGAGYEHSPWPGKCQIRPVCNHPMGMRRDNRAVRRSLLQSTADRLSGDVCRRLGGMLKDSRLQPRVTQKQAAGKAGISQSAWSRLELGDPRSSVATWGRAACAVGGSLEAYIRRASAAGQPRDAVHLRHQELIIRIATAGGWQALPEEPIDRDARTSRGADVLLRRLYSGPGRANASERAEYALVEIWD